MCNTYTIPYEYCTSASTKIKIFTSVYWCNNVLLSFIYVASQTKLLESKSPKKGSLKNKKMIDRLPSGAYLISQVNVSLISMINYV